jgi:hypothetical protein
MKVRVTSRKVSLVLRLEMGAESSEHNKCRNFSSYYDRWKPQRDACIDVAEPQDRASEERSSETRVRSELEDLSTSSFDQ